MDSERSAFVCDECEKTFQLRSSLLRHQNSDHKRVKRGLKCALCDEVITNIDFYYVHAERSHGINIDSETKIFNTLGGE